MIRLWHDIRQLPTPGIPLMVRIRDGREVEAVRPGYVESRDAEDLGYRTVTGEPVGADAVSWSIR